MKQVSMLEAKQKLKKHIRVNFDYDKDAAEYYGVTPAHLCHCLNVQESQCPTVKMLASIGLKKEMIIVKLEAKK